MSFDPWLKNLSAAAVSFFRLDVFAELQLFFLPFPSFVRHGFSFLSLLWRETKSEESCSIKSKISATIKLIVCIATQTYVHTGREKRKGVAAAAEINYLHERSSFLAFYTRIPQEQPKSSLLTCVRDYRIQACFLFSLSLSNPFHSLPLFLFYFIP